MNLTRRGAERLGCAHCSGSPASTSSPSFCRRRSTSARDGAISAVLPLSAGLDHTYGNLAVLFGVAAALVGSVTFGRAEPRFDIPAFVGTAGVGLVTVTPFILARAGLTLGVAPRHFDILTTFAYVSFFAVVGLLVGGCWSVVVRAIRDAYARHAPQQPGTRHGRWN